MTTVYGINIPTLDISSKILDPVVMSCLWGSSLKHSRVRALLSC